MSRWPLLWAWWSSPNNMLYSVKFILILRRINDHDHDDDEFKKHQLSLFFLFCWFFVALFRRQKVAQIMRNCANSYFINKSEHYYPLSPNFFLTSSVIHVYRQWSIRSFQPQKNQKNLWGKKRRVSIYIVVNWKSKNYWINRINRR